MKKTYLFFRVLIILLFTSLFAKADINWPQEISLKDGGKIIIYQPQPESLLGPNLKSRAAIMVKANEKAEPLFGVIWNECYLATDRDSRMATLESIKITDVRFPDVQDTSKINELKKIIETEIIKLKLDISLDELAATLEENKKQTDANLNTSPPKIIYKDKPSTLVLIDGEPIVKKDDKMNLERVLNTPYLLVKSPEDKKYYLYGDKIWYRSDQPKGEYAVINKLPKSINNLDEQIKKQIKENNDTMKAPSPAPSIIISTEPAELISSDGIAKFSSVEGTGLLYMSNTTNNIFMDVGSQNYFVLFSGRWYKSKELNGPWTYVESDKLPADFSKILEGTEKDVVLASVAGTEASKEAIMDAQIPQTAKVDRKTSTVTVTYDGEPKFEAIEGTSLELAVNTSSTVMKAGGKYHAVENGIWYVSSSAKGPWSVSDERPKDVENIPPSSSAYNTKYVYVYESTPEVVYVGYTPGYTGCYVYGSTIVYGTGYYYTPWYGMYYYPRPVTYGFSFHFNPWYGWSMGFGVNYGMIHMSYYGGGWYGCGHHYPPYAYHHYGYHGGYYGPRGGNYYRTTNINIDNSNNIYRNRDGVSTRQANPVGDRGNLNKPSPQPSGDRENVNRPSTQPAGDKSNKASTRPSTSDNKAKPTTSTPNNVYSDRQGNVYQDNKGDWQQRNNGDWKSATPSTNPNVNQMQKDQQSRSRGNMNYNNTQRAMPHQSTPSQRSAPARSSGGGGRKR